MQDLATYHQHKVSHTGRTRNIITSPKQKSKHSQHDHIISSFTLDSRHNDSWRSVNDLGQALSQAQMADLRMAQERKRQEEAEEPEPCFFSFFNLF